MLKAGFARIDITPPLDIEIAGYYEKRIADGVIDPLLATAVAFDDGDKKAIVMSVDVIGISQIFAKNIRKEISDRLGICEDGIIICATHTHTGPLIPGAVSASVAGLKYAAGKTAEDLLENKNARRFKQHLVDLAALAIDDLAPAKMLYTHGEVNDVAFIRRYRMKDGTIRTNPGWQNPDILEAIGKPDEESSLLIIKREGKKEIGIINFQVHPDLIGRTRYSADYPKFVRDTYEANIENSLCMYINGAAGNLNHIDVRLNPETDCAKGYERAKHIGRKIAYSVLSNYPLAKEIEGENVRYAQKNVSIKYNKGTKEETEEAVALYKVYTEKGSDAAVPGGNAGMRRTQILAKATRIVSLMNLPDYADLIVSALRVGDVIFGGIPGEPFTEIGMEFKKKAACTLAIFSCLANGNQGYYPIESALSEGGYEANSTCYAVGTAEKLLSSLIEISNGLKNIPLPIFKKRRKNVKSRNR